MDQSLLNEFTDTRYWHTLYFKGKSVGSYRLKPGSDHLKREIEFVPLASMTLKDTCVAESLRKQFLLQSLNIDDHGGITVKLGPNRSLEPVSRHIAHLYNYQQKGAS